ncbi:hypothetical protein H2248_003493 [Termitomyces sp. 'cryptogamus']|nr:hypothetical protein H2248_003493 [Termitomyces sp. 'cryptogamus']
MAYHTLCSHGIMFSLPRVTTCSWIASYILQHGNFPCGVPAYVFGEIEHSCALRCRSCHGADLWTYPIVHRDVLGKFPVAEGLQNYLELLEEEGGFIHNKSR